MKNGSVLGLWWAMIDIISYVYQVLYSQNISYYIIAKFHRKVNLSHASFHIHVATLVPPIRAEKWRL
jgi:hypothetical protein